MAFAKNNMELFLAVNAATETGTADQETLYAQCRNTTRAQIYVSPQQHVQYVLASVSSRDIIEASELLTVRTTSTIL